MVTLLTSVNGQALPCSFHECDKHYADKYSNSVITNDIVNQLRDEKQKDCKVKSETISVGNNLTITNNVTICGSDKGKIRDNMLCTGIICNVGKGR